MGAGGDGGGPRGRAAALRDEARGAARRGAVEQPYPAPVGRQNPRLPMHDVALVTLHRDVLIRHAAEVLSLLLLAQVADDISRVTTVHDLPESELAGLIVRTLNLEVAAGEIDPEAPLYGEGLGLDSIDILELALAVSQQFGVKLRADDENNIRIFASLRSLNAHIQAHRSA